MNGSIVEHYRSNAVPPWDPLLGFLNYSVFNWVANEDGIAVAGTTAETGF
jgi:hypothetical protein